MAQQVYEQWFRVADADKDGAVGGAEAVNFFLRSGLPQNVLGQIWEMSSGGGPKLNQFQFSSAMRLVALAQVNGGQLPLEQARAIVAGVGPALPLPTLQGLDVPGSLGPSARPAAPTPAPAPAPVPMPAPGGYPGAPPAYGAPPPGAAPLPAAVAAPVAAAAPVGGFPPLPAPELQRYQAQFMTLDTDRDGFLTGAECFAFFSQSGLDKAVLRDIWTLVAGTSGTLSGQQFVAYLYLIDLVKRGMPLPAALPPGLAGFPPVAPATAPPVAAAPVAAPPPAPVAAAPAAAAAAQHATWSLQSQFGTSNNITAVLAAPAPSNMAAPPPPPAMPQRLDPSALPPVPAPPPHTSGVPAVPASLLAGVTAMERTKLQEEQQVCETKEKALMTAEERAAEARARQQQYTTVLQELVVFGKRTELALLTSQDQARRLEEELERTKQRYDSAYKAAEAASEKSAAVHAHIMELMGQKAELEEKMKRLEGEIAAAERMGPADVARLEAELAELNSRVAAAEASRNAKVAGVDGVKRQQEAARAQLEALKESDREAGAEVEACQASLADLEKQLQEARSSSSLAVVPSLLSRTAAVYRGLHGLAARGGVSVPFDSLPATLSGLHVWADEVAAGVLDWADDDADARGFITVNALPGADAPKPIVKGAAPAAAAAPPKPASAAAAPVAKPAAAAAATASAPAAAPKMLPDDFASPSGDGFGDAPAFGDGPAFGSGPAPTPVPLAAATSGSVGGAASVPSPGATLPAAPSAAASGGGAGGAGFAFSFEEEPPAFSASSGGAAPAAAVAAAAPAAAGTGFGDDAFGATPSLATGSAGGSGATAFGSEPAPTAAAAAAAPVAASSGFGDDAFGGSGSAFGDAPAFGSVEAAAPAPSAPAPLPTADSGALEENPFAGSAGSPAGLAAAVGSVGGAAVAAPAAVGFGEEDNAFGSTPAPATAAAAAPAAAVAPAAAGFGDNAFGGDNPFGDDNPFGAK